MTWKTMLRRKVFAPIIKAPKKNLFTVGNLTFFQELDMDMPETKKAYILWRTKTQGLSKDAIGVKGKAASKEGKRYNDTLFEHILEHVHPDVQRPKQPRREGALDIMELLQNAIEDDDTPISDQDADDIYDLVDHIRKMGGTNSDVNPANIPFTEPRELVPPKRTGEKWGKQGSKKVYGHYRTPMYREMRQKVYRDKNAPTAVDSSWYSDAQDGSARPPFWQGLFAQSTIGGGVGTVVPQGLLGILEALEKGIDGAKLSDFTVVDKRKASDPKFIKGLTTNHELVARLEAALKNPSMYPSNGNRKIIGMRLMAEINDKPYTDKKWIDNDLGLQQLFDGVDVKSMPMGWEGLKTYKLKLTAASIDNVINEVIRGKLMMAPNGRPYMLPTDGKKLKNYPWHPQYVAAFKNELVKKSWIDTLWG